MKNHKIRTAVLALAWVLSALGSGAPAWAGGFQSGSPMARALGLGGAATGLPDEAGAVFSNPASLSFVRGTNLMLGATVTMPDYGFIGVLPSTATSKMNPQSLFPPSIALTHTFDSGLGIGVFATIPYYVKTSWSEDWVGSPIVISSEVRGVQVSPVVAFRIGRDFSAGVALQAMFLRMDHTRRYGETPDIQTGRFATMSMTGSADVAYGFELGLMYSPRPNLGIGLALKSKTTAEITNGTMSYTGNPTESSATVMPSSSFATTLTLPEKVRGGITFKPFRGLTLSGELEWARWAGVKGVTIRLGAPVTSRIIDQSGWKNVLAYRGGMELAVADILLRGGAGYEPSPVPDAELRPSMPDGNCFHYSLGIGYAIEEGLMLDLGVEVNRYADRTVTDSHVQYATDKYFNGTYVMSSTVIALTISYSWK